MRDYPHATFRIEMGPELRLGPGKIGLLEQIAKTGSISAAARAMGMSYRRAWLLIEETNRLLSAPLVESSAGGSGGGGAKLTPLAEEVIAAYRALETDVNGLVAKRLGGFPGLRSSPSAANARRSKQS
mgnify:CR=1 FL=1